MAGGRNTISAIPVTPAKAGVQANRSTVRYAWIPAFAGMTPAFGISLHRAQT